MVKNEMLIEVVLDKVADYQASYGAGIAHVFRAVEKIKSVFKSPEDNSSYDTHPGIKHKCICVVRYRFWGKTENIFFVEQVFANQAGGSAD